MAFPTTGILDDFNRANSSDLGTSWDPNPFNNSGDKRLGIASNGVIHVAENYAAEWYNAASYGADVEVYATVPNRPTGGFSSVRLDARLASPSASASTADSYRVRVMAANTDGDWIVSRVDDTSETQLGATATQSWADGASIGLEIIGSTIKAYHKASGGSWAEVMSRTDTTYTAAGLLAIHCNGGSITNPNFDDFGGGTVVGAGGDPEGLLIGGKLLGGGLLVGRGILR